MVANFMNKLLQGKILDLRDRIMEMLDNPESENNAKRRKVRDVIARENMKSN